MQDLTPQHSPYQMQGGTFQVDWPADLCSRVRAFADARVASFFHEYQSDVWKKVAAGCGAIVHESQNLDETGIARTRCVTLEPYDASAQDTAAITYLSQEKLKHYKKTVERYDVIAKVSDHCDVLRTTTKPQLLGIISTREFVDVLCNYRCRDGAFVQYASQAPQEVLDQIPVQAGAIRGRDINILTVLRQHGDNAGQCHGEQVFQTEVGGSLPKWAVKKALPQTMIDSVKMVRDMTTQFPNLQIFRQKADLFFDWAVGRK
mmetsp:Transcript_129213/g.257997  ORF Transcript_129213/g.257997 Transcript_129213/m.257997 type:complete len:261 (+) Transcript_129213:107-889(+)